jgi:hypothetical protein
MAVFWFVVPCSLVEVYQRFRDTCCLHHQDVAEKSVNFYQTHGATTQKAAIFILATVRTLHLI